MLVADLGGGQYKVGKLTARMSRGRGGTLHWQGAALEEHEGENPRTYNLRIVGLALAELPRASDLTELYLP